MKKRGWVLLVMVCVALMLGGCVPQQSEPEESKQLDPAPPIDPVNSGDSIADSAFIGTFENTYNAMTASLAADLFAETDVLPTLTFQTDGTFELVVVNNLSTFATRTVSGSFTVDGDTAVLETESDGTLKVVLLNERELRVVLGQADSLSAGDIFERAEG